MSALFPSFRWYILACLLAWTTTNIQAQTTSCKTTLTADSATFSDRTTTTKTYANNLDCSWLIRPQIDADVVILSFTKFRTETNDLVRVYEGAEEKVENIVGEFSGSKLPSRLITTKKAFLIRFTTNASVVDSGWTAQYTSLVFSCKGVTRFTADSATFADHTSSTATYSNGLDCYWSIRPPVADSIRLSFSRFRTDVNDFVTVYEGNDTTARVLGRFSGTTVPPTIVTEKKSLLLRFTSGLLGTDAGWVAKYQVTPTIVLADSKGNSIVGSLFTFPTIVAGLTTATVSYTLSGVNLPPDSTLLVQATSGFQLSLSNGVFSEGLRLKPNQLPVQIIVRFNPTIPGNFTGVVVHAIGSAPPKYVFATGTAAPSIFWQPTNGPYTARIYSLAVLNGSIYTGAFGELYRSTSDGAAWSRLTTLQNTRANALAYGGGYLFIGTSFITATGVLTGSGIVRASANGGNQTFIRFGADNSPAQAVNAILIRNGKVFAGTNGGVFGLNSVSETTPSPLNNGLSGSALFVKALAFSGMSLIAGTSGGIYRSDNDGTSWQESNTGLDNKNVVALVLNGTSLFAGTLGGIYRSDDNGASWQLADPGAKTSVAALVVSGSSVFAGIFGKGIYRSDDNGLTWQAVNTGLTENFINALTASDNIVFAGTNNGVFVSADNGGRWQPANTGLAAGITVSLLTRGALVYAGMAGAGILRSDDNGETWMPSNTGIDDRFIGAFTTNGSDMYAASYDFNGGGIFRSSDNGGSWSEIKTGVNGGIRYYTLLTSGQTVFAGGDNGNTRARLLRSNDNGMSWTDLPLGGSLAAFNSAISTLLATNFFLFAGTGGSPDENSSGQGVFRSSDNGATWVPVSNGMGANRRVFSLIAVNNTLMFAATDGGIFRSGDFGDTWNNVSPKDTVLKGALPHTLVFVNGSLYAGTNYVGIFRSRDYGGTWEQVSQELPRADNGSYQFVDALAASDGVLYAGLSGNYIHRASLLSSVIAARAELVISSDITKSPGDEFTVPIKMGKNSNLPSPPPIATATLLYNASLLEPLSDAQNTSVVDGQRAMRLDSLVLSSTTGATVKTLRFRALLGDSPATPLFLIRITATNANLTAPNPGLFTLTGLSNAGGATRLFRSGSLTLVSKPNPASDAVEVNYSTIESGTNILKVVNMFGQEVKNLVNAPLPAGTYTTSMKISDLPQGTYFLLLQTPTQLVSYRMEVVR